MDFESLEQISINSASVNAWANFGSGTFNYVLFPSSDEFPHDDLDGVTNIWGDFPELVENDGNKLHKTDEKHENIKHVKMKFP